MKSRILLLFTLTSAILSSSCSSEYSERLDQAKELKQELSKALNEQERFGVDFNDEITDIMEQIYFHAKVSGNEELFLEELNNMD